MKAKQTFADDDTPTKTDGYFGQARYTSPATEELNIQSLNLSVPFGEAMKLSLAIQACLMKLNSYSRSTKKGKNKGMLLSIKLKDHSISVIERDLPSTKTEDESE